MGYEGGARVVHLRVGRCVLPAAEPIPCSGAMAALPAGGGVRPATPRLRLQLVLAAFLRRLATRAPTLTLVTANELIRTGQCGTMKNGKNVSHQSLSSVVVEATGARAVDARFVVCLFAHKRPVRCTRHCTFCGTNGTRGQYQRTGAGEIYLFTIRQSSRKTPFVG